MDLQENRYLYRFFCFAYWSGLDCFVYLCIGWGMQKTFSESSLTWWSMFVVAVVLVLVYIVFFSLREKWVSTAAISEWIKKDGLWDERVLAAVDTESITEQEIDAERWTTIPEIQIVAEAIADTSNPTEETIIDQPAMKTQAVTPPIVSDNWSSPSYIVSAHTLFTAPSEQQAVASISQVSSPIPETEILYLPWTHHWVGVMKSAAFLGIAWQIQYVLKNNDNTHFAYLGKDLPEIADSLTTLWWKSIAFTQKNDIYAHWLFGDKIIFLLVPQYIGKKELFFVYFAEARDRWFIQVDHDIFETTKPLLAELFAKRYNR